MRSPAPTLARVLGVVAALVACTGQPSTPPPSRPPPAPLDDAEPAPPPKAAQDAETLPVPDVTPSEPRYAASHVLVAYQGAARAPQGVTRTREQALTLARELHDKARQGADLAKLARTHSDGPTAPRGGHLGVYETGTMVPDFEKAVASVDVGQLAPLIHTPFGYHVIRRDPVVEARLQHVQIAFEGAWRSTTDRTREQARTRAREVLERLSAGESFEQVARTTSDDPSAQVNGGDLGRIAPGQLVPAFEDAAFALEPGETSGIVETPYGFHVIRRLP